MKKILGLILILLLLTGCGKEDQLSLDKIQSVKSKEELAELLNCDPLDLDTIATENIILDVSNDYYGTRRKVALKLHDNLNDYDFTTDSIEFVLQRFNLDEYYSYAGVNPGDNPPYEDGEIIYGGGVFDINNLTCMQATGHVYKLSIPEELYYIAPNNQKYVNYYYTNEISGITWFEKAEITSYEFDRLFGIE